MRYYLIAGEASSDLHASHLMQALRHHDAEAQFRFYGGDQMQAAGGTMVKHYRDLAYMGFVPVLLHLPTILKNMRRAKRDILEWQPDALILVDYPGFNLSIAKHVKKHSQIPVYYYISPKIWAWKEHRIKNIKRDVDELFSILPFEVAFFEGKHHYPIHYVGNPTADEVREFQAQPHPTLQPPPSKPVIALLCGSRRQEIKENLPTMLLAAEEHAQDYQLVIAGAPSIDAEYYEQFIKGHLVQVVSDQTYALLSQAHAALVTSGTATLETALFGVPQVVCYRTPMPRFFSWLRKRLLKVKYISLVNLIADREVVCELVATGFTVDSLKNELKQLLPADSPQRLKMLQGYKEVERLLGTECAPENAAQLMVRLLSNHAKP